jgi:hypothetical protein
VASPVVSEGRIYLCGGDGSGDRQAAGVDLNRNDASPALAWETRNKVFPYVPCMLTRGAHVYFVSDAGIACCLDAKTGDSLWVERLDGGPVTASPILVEGRIYALTEDGHAFVFAAEPAFKMLASSKLDEGVMASPAIADGRFVVRGKQHLYCFGKTGK